MSRSADSKIVATKVHMGMDAIEIFGRHLGKVEGTFSILEGHTLEEIESI